MIKPKEYKCKFCGKIEQVYGNTLWRPEWCTSCNSKSSFSPIEGEVKIIYSDSLSMDSICLTAFLHQV